MAVRQPDRGWGHVREGLAHVSRYLQRLSPSEIQVRAGVVLAGGAFVATGIGLAHRMGRRRSVRLLHHMGELVGEEAAALRRPRRILARRKRNIAPEREGACVDAPGRRARGPVRMHPYPREVAAKALLHVLPQRRLQWPAGVGEGTIYA